MIAGLLSFRKYDHLSGTAFIGYAALWGSYGATRIFLGANQHNTNSTLINATMVPFIPPHLKESAIAGLVPYILLSLLLAFCSATVNYIMPFVFGAITLTLVFEAVGLVAGWALVVSGVLELLILLFAIYGSAALLIKGVAQRYALKGFGNPLFNVLLLGTTNDSSSKSIGQEKKKNTKYAEPMALGFFCDTVSPFIFAFYAFGYFPSITVSAIWISINSAAQLLSSYYAYLRQDCYHATKFGLHCTFWLVKTWEEYVISELTGRSDAATARQAMVGNWFFLAASLVLCVTSLNMDMLELIHNGIFFLLTISTISQIPLNGYYIFCGVACSIFMAVSLYGTFARLINTIAEKSLIPVGPQPVSTDRLQSGLGWLKKSQNEQQQGKGTQLPDALFYLVNGVAALSAIHSSQPHQSFLDLTVPWVFIPGAIIQGYVSRLQVQGGQRFGSVIPAFYLAIWATWTWFRLAAAYRNLVLLALTIVMEVIVVCLLLSTLDKLPYQLEVAMLSIFAIICLYGTLASLVNCIFSKTLIPVGPALLKNNAMKKKAAATAPCPTPSSRGTSGLLQIAKLLENNGVCGIPTDTVYALAASCKNPSAIERIYNIKERPLEKPICICISNLEQLVATKPPFSPLLWEFMRNVYPGGISCIVPKGDWLLKLGVGAAYDRVGTKDSIMIRVPDHTVTAHLCAMTGPLAITSANPSGEPDSTHHDMIIDRLGHKIQGVLCDGHSNELVGSTVVSCLKIDEGTINILREGCVPATKVQQTFERVKSSML
ncbi:YrdC domain-containing protein, mitochondrial [Bagarius yarrelli]|uniref:Threonylcarbamoyl-AMP synthase n=1 Tax=Bagarius yarrelli TaxID=175774 RepID=A0A556U1R7_BAGYA|nr:YrdC domain-containing protein, mitochondrial [Bagarius yarrelli]